MATLLRMRARFGRFAVQGRGFAPGWVRTEMGGPGAPLAIEDSVPNVVSTLLAVQGKPGLQYLDYLGRTVPW
jgi:hypothetical protein